MALHIHSPGIHPLNPARPIAHHRRHRPTRDSTPGRGAPSTRQTVLCLFIGLVGLLPSSTPANAQQYLAIRDQQNGPAFTYDPRRQYVRIRLKNLALPKATQDQPRWRAFLSTLFQGRRSDFSVSTIKIAINGDSTYQAVLYSIEKQGNNFTTSALAGPGPTGYHLTDEFAFDESIPIRLVISRSDWEERNDILSSLATSLGGIAGVETAALSEATSQLFNVASLLFPPSSAVMAVSTTIVPSDLERNALTIGSTLSGHSVDLFTLQFDTVPGHFRDYDLSTGLRRAHLTTVLEPWRKMIEEADEQAASTGFSPVYSTITSFARYVSRLSLTRYDRAILTACAIKEWAPNVFYGTQANNEKVQFTHNHYSRLPTGDLNAIRKSDCAINTPVSCNTDVCRFMVDFLNKSSIPSGRRYVAQTHLDEYLALTLYDQLAELAPDDYIDRIRIPRPGRFRIDSTVPDSWTFAFEPGNLPLSIDGTSHTESAIFIDVIRIASGEAERFIVTGIRVE